MMRTITGIVVCLVVSAHAAAETVSLGDVIRAIKTCDEIGAAGRLYAKGRALDREDPTLCRAFVRRALQLGRPMIAMQPARELVRMVPGDSLGWAGIGYIHARRGQPRRTAPGRRLPRAGAVFETGWGPLPATGRSVLHRRQATGAPVVGVPTSVGMWLLLRHAH